MKKQLLTLFIIISFSAAFGQVGINTTTPGAQLDVRSSNQAAPANTDGILIPKVDVFPATNPTAAQNGMMVFLATAVGAKPPGFYYWDSATSTWTGLALSTSGWALAGNTGTVPGTDFLGTTDAKDFVFKTNNSERARFTSGGFLGIGTTTPAQQLELTGNFRLPVSTSTTGILYAGTFRFAHNLGGTYFGTNAGNLATTSSWNTGIGQNVMQSQTTGNFNVGVGATALASSTGGFSNSAIGYQALNGLTTGGDNTAMGSSVMRSLTTGSRNIAIGSQAMIGSATSSSDNVAMGYGALAGNGVSFFNTAIGSAALNATSTGANNTAIGRSSMQSNTTGSRNTALGYNSLFSGLTTTNNTAIGYEAGRDVTGSGNVMLGYQAGYSEAGSNKLYIDNSNTASPLVYGDFNTNLLRVNGTLNINNTYSLPTTDGTLGQVLTTNGAGAVAWGAAVAAETDPNAWLKTGNAGTTAGTNFLGTTDATDFVFKTNNTERARFASTGFMGIGVNAPSAYLDINGNNGIANSLLLRSGNNNNDFGASQIAFSWNGGSDYKHSIKSRHNAFGDSGNAIDFVLWDQGTDGTSAMGTKKVMTIDGDGNGKVGIGTVSPAKELEVVGEIRTSSLSGTGYRFVQADDWGTFKPVPAGTASQVLLGTGVWGNVPGITNDWSITGNVGTVPGTNFIGTTDNQAIDFRTNNVITTRFTTKGQIETLNTGKSVFVGEEAGANDDLTDNYNVNIGYQAGKNNSIGTRNVSIGHQALTNNTSNNNVAIGSLSLTNSTTGSDNIALGTSSLTNTTTGGNNIAMGTNALSGNTTGLRNVALGSNTLGSNNGNLNVGIGDKVLVQNSTGTANTAIGAQAMFSNTTGGNNVAVGFSALINNISGIQNTAIGFYAGQNATGTGNVFIGNRAGSNETGNGKLYIANSNTTSPLIYGDFGAALLRVNGTLNINNTYSLPTTDGTAGQSLTTDGAGVVSWSNGAADNMGNHTAIQNVQLNDNYLSNDGDNEGIVIDNNGNVGVGTATPDTKLHVTGNTKIQNGTLTLYSNDSADKIQLTDWADMGSKINHSAGWSIDYMAGPGDWDTDGQHRFFTSVSGVGYTERMRINNNGNVGIGSVSPTQAKLVVNGTEDNTLSYGYLMSDGTVGTNSGTAGFSVYASGRIAATEFNAFSDERIKNIKGISNSAKDLETLNKIQITDYTFKDSIGKGTGTNKKVIAQQVEKVYPQAVSTITDVIPDIYTLTKIKDGRVILKNTLQKGDRVKLVFDNRTELVTVLQADEFGFNVAAKDEGKVFVFGREVKDFHTVDYEALSTLNISATQELIKIINQQEAQIRGLKADNSDMNKRLSQTEADINQIKNMFNNTVSSNSK